MSDEIIKEASLYVQSHVYCHHCNDTDIILIQVGPLAIVKEVSRMPDMIEPATVDTLTEELLAERRSPPGANTHTRPYERRNEVSSDRNTHPKWRPAHNAHICTDDRRR